MPEHVAHAAGARRHRGHPPDHRPIRPVARRPAFRGMGRPLHRGRRVRLRSRRAPARREGRRVVRRPRRHRRRGVERRRRALSAEWPVIHFGGNPVIDLDGRPRARLVGFSRHVPEARRHRDRPCRALLCGSRAPGRTLALSATGLGAAGPCAAGRRRENVLALRSGGASPRTAIRGPRRRRRERALTIALTSKPPSHPFLDGKPKRLLIGGEWLEAASGKTFETINPATGRALARVAEGDAAGYRPRGRRRAQARSRALEQAQSRSSARSCCSSSPTSSTATTRSWRCSNSLDMGAPISLHRAAASAARVGLLRYYAGAATMIHGETTENSLPGGEYCHLHAEGAGRRRRRDHPVERAAQLGHLEDRDRRWRPAARSSSSRRRNRRSRRCGSAN